MHEFRATTSRPRPVRRPDPVSGVLEWRPITVDAEKTTDFAKENAELAKQNAELRQRLGDLKALEEDLMAKRVFEKSRGYLFSWITVGGLLLTISGVVGIKTTYDYMRSQVKEKIDSVTQEQIRQNIEAEGKKLIATIVENQTADLDAYAKRKIEQIISANTPIRALVGQDDKPVPPQVDLTKEIPFVRDSGQEGSVVGQALATALEDQIFRATGEHRRISARHIYFLARDEGGFGTKSDSGALIKDGVKALSTKGAVEESVWPYRAGEFASDPPAGVEQARKFKITDAQPLSGLAEIKRSLNGVGVLVAGISLFESSMTPEVGKTGIVKMPKVKEQTVGGHAVCLIGYDDAKKLVKFVNSWGAGWGDKGFGYLPYDYVEKYSSDVWRFKLDH